MRVNNEQIVTNAVLNTTVHSSPVNLNQIFMYAIQGIITGTPTGTFTLEGSCDPNSGNIFPTNWTTIDNSSKAVAAAGTFIYSVSDSAYNWARLAYADGSGGESSAVLNANVNTKGF